MGKTNKPKYSSAARMQEAIDAYFADCEGQTLTDVNGDVVTDKNDTCYFHQSLFHRSAVPS